MDPWLIVFITVAVGWGFSLLRLQTRGGRDY
jgi:hypothetical protein